MKDLGRILGSPAWNAPVVVKPDAVYVNTNIVRKDTEEGFEQYEFDCVQYTPEEYMEMTVASLETAENDLTDTQMALAESYELSVATADDLTETQLALAEVYELVIGG